MEKLNYEKLSNIFDLADKFKWEDVYWTLAIKYPHFMNSLFEWDDIFIDLVSDFEEKFPSWMTTSNMVKYFRSPSEYTTTLDFKNTFRDILEIKKLNWDFDAAFDRFYNNFEKRSGIMKKAISNFNLTNWDIEWDIIKEGGKRDIYDYSEMKTQTEFSKNKLPSVVSDNRKKVSSDIWKTLYSDSTSKMRNLWSKISESAKNIWKLDGKKSALRWNLLSALSIAKNTVSEFWKRLSQDNKEEFDSAWHWFTYDEWLKAQAEFEKIEETVSNTWDIENIDVSRSLKKGISNILWLNSVKQGVIDTYTKINSNSLEIKWMTDAYDEAVSYKESQIEEQIKILSAIAVIHAINIFASKINNSIDLSLSKESLVDAVNSLNGIDWLDFNNEELLDYIENLSWIMFVKDLIWENEWIKQWKANVDEIKKISKNTLDADSVLKDMFSSDVDKIEDEWDAYNNAIGVEVESVGIDVQNDWSEIENTVVVETEGEKNPEIKS
jgi:hypothetical protein